MTLKYIISNEQFKNNPCLQSLAQDMIDSIKDLISRVTSTRKKKSVESSSSVSPQQKVEETGGSISLSEAHQELAEQTAAAPIKQDIREDVIVHPKRMDEEIQPEAGLEAVHHDFTIAQVESAPLSPPHSESSVNVHRETIQPEAGLDDFYDRSSVAQIEAAPLSQPEPEPEPEPQNIDDFESSILKNEDAPDHCALDPTQSPVIAESDLHVIPVEKEIEMTLNHSEMAD